MLYFTCEYEINK